VSKQQQQQQQQKRAPTTAVQTRKDVHAKTSSMSHDGHLQQHELESSDIVVVALFPFFGLFLEFFAFFF
jgi:hypothetical protein